jgi:hypothetical protein
MEFLKNLWSSWKVKVSMVGGALVIMTAYGTCTVDPNEEAVKEAVQKKVEGESSEEVAPIPAEEVEKVEEPKEAVEDKKVEEPSEK